MGEEKEGEMKKRSTYLHAMALLMSDLLEEMVGSLIAHFTIMLHHLYICYIHSICIKYQYSIIKLEN